ncbi:hypothetical protein L7F22_016320 [Adiantum nelumboides]|nr:hypothetical protein [Adiantum nelumboides]
MSTHSSIKSLIHMESQSLRPPTCTQPRAEDADATLVEAFLAILGAALVRSTHTANHATIQTFRGNVPLADDNLLADNDPSTILVAGDVDNADVTLHQPGLSSCANMEGTTPGEPMDAPAQSFLAASSRALQPRSQVENESLLAGADQVCNTLRAPPLPIAIEAVGVVPTNLAGLLVNLAAHVIQSTQVWPAAEAAARLSLMAQILPSNDDADIDAKGDAAIIVAALRATLKQALHTRYGVSPCPFKTQGFPASPARLVSAFETKPTPTASPCDLKRGLQALAECQCAGTYADPFSICLPPACRDVGVLTPLGSTYPAGVCLHNHSRCSRLMMLKARAA